MYLLVQSFCATVEENQTAALKPVLNRLCALVALVEIEKQMAEFIECGAIQLELCAEVRRQVRSVSDRR